MRKGQLPALREHHVEVELVAQLLVEPQRFGIKAHRARRDVVRPDDRGVARSVAPGEIAFLQHRHARDAVVARQVVGDREAMAAAADDDDVVGRL